MSKSIKAWYFSDESRQLRYNDGRDIAIGVRHTVKGKPKLCAHGLHASVKLIDALQYAPGPILWRVKVSGTVVEGDDKICGTVRTYLAGGVDISDILRAFARRVALDVAHLWEMPEIVKKYLEAGDESLRAAAWADAWAAAGAAAWDAARDAAWTAARAAAVAARAAVDAAVDAARYAARYAAKAKYSKWLEEMVMGAINGTHA